MIPVWVELVDPIIVSVVQANSTPTRCCEYKRIAISDIVMDKAVLFLAILEKVPDKFA